MEGVIEYKTAYITQSTGHSATINIDANECKNADFVEGTGHSAIFTVETNECKTADFVKCTGHSAATENIKTQGNAPMDGLIASINNCETSGKKTEFQAYIPSSWPIKQDMYVGMNTTPERYIENLYLLGMAWVRKVRHVARLTLNSPTGPLWPTRSEPIALMLFQELSQHNVHWASIRERADFADELDFVWRENPPWLPPSHGIYIPIWEHATGMARTWGWNWHNEARKQGAPEDVWRQEDRYPRTRHHQNTTSAARHHHVLTAQRVPTIASYIRTNKFYRVGDDETTCERPQSSPRCRHKCHHTENAFAFKRQKKRLGLIRAPGVEPENEYGGIE